MLHEHLGLGVAVEDPFGRVLARAGPDATSPWLTRTQRERLVEAAQRVSGPLRVRDRLTSLATSRGTAATTTTPPPHYTSTAPPCATASNASASSPGTTSPTPTPA